MNKEQIREQITFLKLILTILITIDVGSFTWFVNNLLNKSLIKLLYIDTGFIILLTGIIIYTFFEILININNLGK